MYCKFSTANLRGGSFLTEVSEHNPVLGTAENGFLERSASHVLLALPTVN
jgi:hypothetical protein